MRKQSELIKERLGQVMLQDRIGNLETLLTVLKSDITMLLSNYMVLSAGAVEIILDASESGSYEFMIKAHSDRLINPGRMLGTEP